MHHRVVGEFLPEIPAQLADGLLKDVADPFKEEEREDIVNRIIGRLAIDMRSSTGIAWTLTNMEFLGLGTRALDATPEQFRSVTLAEVNAAIVRYFNIENSVVSMAGTFAG